MPAAEDRRAVTGRRIAAGLLDLLGVLILLIGVGLIFHGAYAHNGTAGVNLSGASAFLWALLSVAYYLVPEVLSGQTLGKRMLRLRVQSVDGGAASAAAVAIRTMMRIVDFLPFFYLVGFVVILMTGRKAQRLGDLMARTAVVGA